MNSETRQEVAPGGRWAESPRGGGDPTATRFAADSARYGVAVVIPALVTVAGVALFTRWFTPAQYGVYALVTAASAPAATVLGQLSGNATGRYFRDFYENGEGEVFRLATAWLVGATVLGGVILTVLAGAVLALAGEATPVLLWLIGGAGVGLVATSVMTLLLPILSSAFEVRAFVAVTVGAALASLAVTLALLAVGGHQVAWLVWGPAAGRFVMLPYLWRWAKPARIGAALAATRSLRPVLVRFLRYGTPLVVWAFAGSLLGLGDRYIIGAFRGPGAVALYSVSYSLASQAVGLVTGPMITASWPILLKSWAAAGASGVGRVLTGITNQYVAMGLALVGLTELTALPVAHLLLGGRFLRGVSVMTPILIGSLLWGAGRLIHAPLKLEERTWILALDAVLAGVFNLLLNLVLVPRWGYQGSAWASALGYLAYLALIVRQTSPAVAWRPDGRAVAASGLAVGAAWLGTMLSAVPLTAHAGAWVQGAARGGEYLALLAVLRRTWLGPLVPRRR